MDSVRSVFANVYGNRILCSSARYAILNLQCSKTIGHPPVFPFNVQHIRDTRGISSFSPPCWLAQPLTKGLHEDIPITCGAVQRARDIRLPSFPANKDANFFPFQTETFLRGISSSEGKETMSSRSLIIICSSLLS